MEETANGTMPLMHSANSSSFCHYWENHFSQRNGISTVLAGEEWNRKCKRTFSPDTIKSDARSSTAQRQKWETCFNTLSRSSCFHRVPRSEIVFIDLTEESVSDGLAVSLTTEVIISPWKSAAFCCFWPPLQLFGAV